MRKLAVALVCVVIVLAIRWLASSPSEGGAAHAPEQAPPSSSETTEPALEDVVGAPARESSEREPAQAPTEPATPAAAACNVFGRVTDADEAPLASANVRLQVFQRWSRDVQAPQLGEDERMRGWEVATGADGRFRFELPAPDETSAGAVIVKPDPYHDSVTLYFFRDREPKLQAGDNDLGTIRLASTGSIAGIVRDASGAPIEKARVRTSGASSRSTTYGDECFTDATGRYLLGHVAPGTYGVVADHEAHLSGFRTPVEVGATRTLEGIDFTLTPAPTLKGRVVDEDGALLEGIRVWGWPQSEGKGAGDTTAADGSFTIHLPQDEPYRLEASFDARDGSSIGDRSVHFAPNTAGIELVLPRTVRVTVAVVDGASGAPIERFGLHVSRQEDPKDEGRWKTGNASSLPHPIEHPGGEASVRVRPGIDIYEVVAEGYDDAEGLFTPDESGRMVIRLERGASISGRALIRGEPAEGVTATLEVGRMYRSGPDAPARFRVETYRAARTAKTDADGRFSFAGVQESEDHRLTLRAPGGESLVRVPVQPKAKGLDLGDLVLEPSGAIEGTVLVPPGRSAAGLQIRLDHSHFVVGRTTDANGTFWFESVAPGRHTLFVDEAPGLVSGGGAYDVDVAPGATATIEIDLRDRGTCQVALTLRFSDGPMTGYRVELVPESESQEVATFIGRSKRHQLGTVGEDGRVAGWAPALGPAHVEVRAPRSGTMWRHPDTLLDLALDARIEEELVFETASVAVRLAAGFSMPSRASVRFTMSLPAGFATFSQGGEVPGISGADGLTFDGGSFVFARVPAGEHDLVFELVDKDREPTRTELGPGSWRMAVEPVVAHKARVTLASGRVTEVALP